MSESGGPARPRQLTMASWFVIVGSAFLLLTVFDTLAGLNSVDTREQVAEVLSSPSTKGLGLGVDDALIGMRVALSIAAVCAAVAVVLGVFVLQRHRGARIGLTVVAVPILLTAPLTGLVGALVAAATAMLWSGQGRDWFAGRPVREASPLFAPRRREAERGGWPPARDHRSDTPEENRPEHEPPPPTPTRPEPDPERPGTPPASAVSTGTPSDQPPRTSGFGTSDSAAGDPPAEGERHDLWSARPEPEQQGGAGAPAYLPQAGPAHPQPHRVPGPVKMACILTWVFSGLVALLYAAIMVVLLVAQDRVVELIVDSPAWTQANLDRDVLVPVLWVGSLMFLGWSLGALALAWFTWRRHEWARYLLVASAAGALIASTFAFPVGIAHQLAAVATIWGLFSAPARAWFSGRTLPGPPPGPRQGPPAPPPPAPPPPAYQDRPGPW